VLAPAGTPKEIIAKLNAEILKALADPATRKRLDDQGLVVRGSSPEELGVLTKQQLAKYGKLIDELGIAQK
jgi:tripartite-type tricarboxylate transporter receptor subunit TctC